MGEIVDLVTRDEAAAELRVCVKTVDRLIADGERDALRDRRRTRIHASSLEAYAARKTRRGAKAAAAAKGDRFCGLFPLDLPGAAHTRAARVRVTIETRAGVVVRRVLNRAFRPGEQSVVWDGRSGHRKPAASGR